MMSTGILVAKQNTIYWDVRKANHNRYRKSNISDPKETGKEIEPGKQEAGSERQGVL